MEKKKLISELEKKASLFVEETSYKNMSMEINKFKLFICRAIALDILKKLQYFAI